MLKTKLLLLIFLFVVTVSINAHPLGNFSLNNFSRITFEKQTIRLHYVLDMAEIPTFQELQKNYGDKSRSLSEAELVLPVSAG